MGAKRLKLFKKHNTNQELAKLRGFKLPPTTKGHVEREHETGMAERPHYVWQGGVK